jgi:hypothetical protein
LSEASAVLWIAVRRGNKYMKKGITKLVIVLTFVSVLFFFTSGKGYTAARMQGYKALKVFAQAKSDELTPGFNIYETENFIIKYTDEDEDIVRDIGRIFEKSRKIEEDHYEYYQKGKTVVFLYKDQESMWEHQQSVKGQAVMGLYNMGIIHVLSPKAYLSRERLKKKDFEVNGPILHEYVHKVLDDRSGGNIELWFTEGLALYEEYAVDGAEWAKGFTYGRYYTSSELRHSFMELDEVQAYRQSYDIVTGLALRYGREKINETLDELKNGSTIEEAFLKVYNMKLNEFIDSDMWKAQK